MKNSEPWSDTGTQRGACERRAGFERSEHWMSKQGVDMNRRWRMVLTGCLLLCLTASSVFAAENVAESDLAIAPMPDAKASQKAAAAMAQSRAELEQLAARLPITL